MDLLGTGQPSMPTKIVFKLTRSGIFPILVVCEKVTVHTWPFVYAGTQAPANAANFNIP